MNNPIWLMTSAFRGMKRQEIIPLAGEIGAQGLELCVFRREGARRDHVATHVDYETFGPDDAKPLLEAFNAAGLRFSIGAYENLIGGDPGEREKNQNHLLRLIRIAHWCGGNANDVVVGTFVGYNHELGMQDGGFQKNLDEYVRIFGPIVKYAADLGVTICYENCPMEGWRSKSWPVTYNNLPGTLAARKLMYELIPSAAHGETYDPSHDVWQNVDPSDVIRASDMARIRRVHVKATRIRQGAARVHWGGLFPMQSVDPALARRAGVPVPAHDWDRHHYEAMLPGFGGNDSMDWREFLGTLMDRGFGGPFVVENEAGNSAHTGSPGATVQGFQATVLNLAPAVWPLTGAAGYRYDRSHIAPMSIPRGGNLPAVTMRDLA